MHQFIRVILLGVMVTILAACQASSDVSETVAALPDGDPARGETLFAESIDGAPTCTSCHALTDASGIGPGLAGYAEIAGNRVDGQSAEVYTYITIMTPSDYIVNGYGNLMYAEYRSRLDEQQVADLIAFMLEQD